MINRVAVSRGESRREESVLSSVGLRDRRTERQANGPGGRLPGLTLRRV